MRKMRLLIAGRDWVHELAEKPSQGPGLTGLAVGRERKRKRKCYLPGLLASLINRY